MKKLVLEMTPKDHLLITAALKRHAEWLDSENKRNPNRFVLERKNEIDVLCHKIQNIESNVVKTEAE